MSENQKHLLLISYVFPPYPGVGGRRWAKFAKYFAQKGYIIHVICAKNHLKEISLFISDIQHPNIYTYPLPTLFPSILLKEKGSIIDRLHSKLSMLFLKLMVRGNFYDRGSLWKNQLLKHSISLIKKNNIKNVIVTGAPFSLLHHSIELQNLFPDINLIGDLRDPWTWGNGYGMKNISAKRKEVECKMEQNVIKQYNIIFIPSEEMKTYLIQKYPQSKNKFILLPHGFDKNEIKILPKNKSDKKRLLFYGTIYKEIAVPFQNLANFISKYYNNIRLDIYSDSKRYIEYFDEKNLLKKHVNYFESISPSKLFEKISNYDYVLIMQPDFAKDYITTKVYEIIYSQTPIILISEIGKLSQFIVDNNLGIHLLPEQIDNKLLDFLKVSHNHFTINSFEIMNYSYDTITNKIIEQLK